MVKKIIIGDKDKINNKKKKRKDIEDKIRWFAGMNEEQRNTFIYNHFQGLSEEGFDGMMQLCDTIFTLCDIVAEGMKK